MVDLVTPLTPWLHSPRSSTDVSSLRAPAAAPAASDLVSKLQTIRTELPVRFLLPSPAILYQHPLHVVTSRQLLGPYTAKPPLRAARDNLYLRSSQDPTIRRSFVEATSSGFVDGDGKDIKTVKATLPPENDILSVAKEIYGRYGWRGFYRGVLAAHCVDLLHAGLAYNLEVVAKEATAICVGEEEENRPIFPMYRRLPWPQRMKVWLRRSEGRRLLAKLLALNVAGVLTYPLSTVSLRQIAYESYDGVRVGFLDMARLTILYDGSGAFYRGIGPYILAKLITSTVQFTTSCASAISDFPNVTDRAGAIANVLVSPLQQHSRHLRALSNMPGLPQECPPLKSRIPALFSPICLLDLVSNVLFMVYQCGGDKTN